MNVYEGRVTSRSGAPVAGATLTVESTGDSTETDSNGEFVVHSKSMDPEITIITETDDFSDRVSIHNEFGEHSRVRIDITIDSILQRASKTDFNVKAQMVGACDLYFENRSVIRQANRVPTGTVCTLEVDLLADGVRLDGATVALQYASCDRNALWKTLGTAQTGTKGRGRTKISFEYVSSATFCRYRVVAPFQLGNAWPVIYPIDTFAEQAAQERLSRK